MGWTLSDEMQPAAGLGNQKLFRDCARDECWGLNGEMSRLGAGIGTELYVQTVLGGVEDLEAEYIFGAGQGRDKCVQRSDAP